MQRHARRWWRLPVAIFVTALCLFMSARASQTASSRALVCQTIEQAAAANGLPTGFLARLLWIESRFDELAISPAGAVGIAQFMPRTAVRRGLTDPRDPLMAIAEAAHLLADMRAKFGNLGLAAAAYNAGAERVAAWLGGGAELARETQLYVFDVTGRRVDDWAWLPTSTSGTYDDALSGFNCLGAGGEGLPREARGPRQPQWQIQLASRFAKAIDLFNAATAKEDRSGPAAANGRPRLPPRGAENSLCAALRASGATCEVFDP